MNISGHSAIVTGGASGLGEATARELAQHGIRVCTIAPGLFSTTMPDRRPTSCACFRCLA